MDQTSAELFLCLTSCNCRVGRSIWRMKMTSTNGADCNTSVTLLPDCHKNTVNTKIAKCLSSHNCEGTVTLNFRKVVMPLVSPNQQHKALESELSSSVKIHKGKSYSKQSTISELLHITMQVLPHRLMTKYV